MGDEKVKCKQMERVGDRWFKREVQCTYTAKKDGYCGHHHPDAVAAKNVKAKARQDATTARWKAKWDAEDQKAKDAVEAPALRAQVASLTIQRDAAEALARENGAQRDEAGRWCLASERDEALAILRELVALDEYVTITSDIRTNHNDIMSHARKLVATP
jgi:hypothetical protein